MYGIIFTTAGLALLASLGAGETLTITRCMVGSGAVGTVEAAQALEDLVQPVAAATSTKPSQKDNQCSFIVEYRNDLNGGLETGFDITEFGVWAQKGSAAEVLLLYGCLSDHPHPISAYAAGGAVEIQRFPVTVAVSNACEVILGYNALAFMTAEDVEQYCLTVVLPLFLDEVDKKIAAHNASPEAHQDIRDLFNGINGRLSRLELQYGTDVSGNPWEVTFYDLEGLVVTGVWNKAQARMEF